MGNARERCRNGVDDDGDGATDLADVGCSGPRDNDEADPPPDAPPAWQSTRGDAYAQALQRLIDAGQAYPCSCSRKDIEQALVARGQPPARHASPVKVPTRLEPM